LRPVFYKPAYTLSGSTNDLPVVSRSTGPDWASDAMLLGSVRREDFPNAGERKIVTAVDARNRYTGLTFMLENRDGRLYTA
jgi:hypothetical protein